MNKGKLIKEINKNSLYPYGRDSEINKILNTAIQAFPNTESKKYWYEHAYKGQLFDTTLFVKDVLLWKKEWLDDCDK